MGKSTAPRVEMKDLSPGLRSYLTRFETAVRENENALFKMMMDGPDTYDKDDVAAIDRSFQQHKQALIRKLIRIQRGDEVTDMEALKREVRTMCRVIRNIQMAPEQATEILRTATSTTKFVQDVIDHRRRL